MNPTEADAHKLADIYLQRLRQGYYKNFAELSKSALTNVVNNPYVRNSNLFVDYFWSYIYNNTNN